MKSFVHHGIVPSLFALSLVVLAVSAASPATAQAEQSANDGIHIASVMTIAPLDASWNLSWDRVSEFLRQSVGSRRRLIQISTIGVCIGLFIMFRSKH